MRNFGIHFAPSFVGFRGAKQQRMQSASPGCSPASAAAEFMSGRPTLGGTQQPADPITARSNTYRADPLAPFPAGSILKSPNPIDAVADVSPTIALAQAIIDFLKVISALAVISVTGIGIAVAFAYWIFC